MWSFLQIIANLVNSEKYKDAKRLQILKLKIAKDSKIELHAS